MKMSDSVPWRLCCWRVLWDVGAMVALGVVLLGSSLAQEYGHVVRRGFFCNDESIRYPNHPSTVPSWALLVATISIPILSIFLGNIFECYICKRGGKHVELSVFRMKVPCWLVRFGYQLRWFVLGMLVVGAVTESAKIVAGRLRPNFLAVCDPDFSLFNCSDEYGLPLFVTNYTCRGDPNSVTEARLSWPSGHSSLSSFAFIYTAFYVASLDLLVVYSRAGIQVLLMFVALMLALFTALSRLTDHKHHPTDILSGAVIGAIVATFIVFYNLHFFGWQKSSKKQQLSDRPLPVSINRETQCSTTTE